MNEILEISPLEEHRSRYNAVAVYLHWTIALLIIGMIPLGLWMDKLPIGIRFQAYTLHKSVGLTILALSIFRLIWRLMNPAPPLPAGLPRHERVLARAAHWVFYGLILAMPLTGWLMVSANPKYPTIFFWLGEVPFIPMPPGINKQATHELFETTHLWLAYGTLALLALHVAAALRHHFILKDSVLRHMLPKRLLSKETLGA